MIIINGNSDNNSYDLLGYIDSNKPPIQIYEYYNQKYIPDWSKDALILKPVLYNKTDKRNIIDDKEIKKVIWTTKSNGVETIIKEDDTHVFLGNKGETLIISSNDLKNNSITYECKILYVNSDKDLELICSDSVTFVKERHDV